MSNRTAIADGADPIQQQDACNLTAVVGCFHRHLLAMNRKRVSDHADRPITNCRRRFDKARCSLTCGVIRD